MSIAQRELELLTVKQAADLLHLDERTVRNHINQRRLRASKLPGGKGWLIRRDDLLTALQPIPSSRTIDRSGIVPAGTHPLLVESEGIIRRTNTLEGRARALAVLDGLQAEAIDELNQSSERPAQTEATLQFRRWDVETWERLEENN